MQEPQTCRNPQAAPKTRKQPGFPVVATILIALVLAAGCGDDETGSGSQGPVTWLVHKAGGMDYASIQMCLFYADDGDTCLVFPGNYDEKVDFMGRAITVVSIDGGENTFLGPLASEYPCDPNAEDTGNTVVRFHNSEGRGSVLDGFTIQNGCANNSNGSGHGGGIYIMAASPVIKNCTVQNNTAQNGNGGGVYILGTGSRPKFENVEFLNNTANGIQGGDGKGGGLSISFGSTQLDGCSFSGNTALGNGPAISAEYGAIVTQLSCTTPPGDVYNDAESEVTCTPPD